MNCHSLRSIKPIIHVCSIYACMYACMHVLCMYPCMHAFMYVCMYVCMHVSMYTHIHTHVHVYIYIYIYIHTYIQTCIYVYILDEKQYRQHKNDFPAHLLIQIRANASPLKLISALKRPLSAPAKRQRQLRRFLSVQENNHIFDFLGGKSQIAQAESDIFAN